MVKETIDELTNNNDMNEGELLALIYLFPRFGQLKKTVLMTLLNQLCQSVVNARNTNEKRFLAASLAVECALKLELESTKMALDALQQCLESGQMSSMKDKLFRIVGKLLTQGGDKHSLFKSMAMQAKKFSKSKDPTKRLQSLSVFRIFAKHLPRSEFMNYLFTYLADSDQNVHQYLIRFVKLQGIWL
jgi:hypothetical protein